MSVTVKCKCGQVLVVPESAAGKKGKCPKCGRVLSLELDTAGGEEAPPDVPSRSSARTGR